MPGFFSTSDLAVVETASAIPKCGTCGLLRSCVSPKMKPTGEGKRKVLFIAEAPGETEDARGVQLVGEVGQEFRSRLEDKFGFDLDRDSWKTNSIVCRPPNNNEPTDLQIDSCRPNLLKTIRELQPEIIILLGTAAVKSLIGYLWRHDESPGPIGRWVGWKIPSIDFNAWICPTWHPSYISRSEKNPVVGLWFDKHLQAALDLNGRPYPDGVPDYRSKVERIYEPEKAASILREMIRRGGVASWDLETTTLKPESHHAQIVCCSVCWNGKKTIAYPWVGEAIVATKEFLLAESIRKVGWNQKFETRWAKKILDIDVVGWIHDGMQCAHVLDNRGGVTGAKFQAFVQLGLPPYDSAVQQYLKATGGNAKNKIREVELRDVLLYNGLDSLVEFLIYEKQKQVMAELE